MDGYDVKSEIVDFGVVITSDGVEDSDIEKAIESSEDTTAIKIKSAKKVLPPQIRGVILPARTL